MEKVSNNTSSSIDNADEQRGQTRVSPNGHYLNLNGHYRSAI